jgi:hypothetical protein
MRVQGRRGLWAEGWRVLVVTGLIALGFLLLGRLQLLLLGNCTAIAWVQNNLTGGEEAVAEAELRVQAEQVRAASASAAKRLPAGHPAVLFGMGFELGYVSQLQGSVSQSPAVLQQQVQAALTPRLQRAQTLAQVVKVGAEPPWPVRTLQDFVELTARIERDETGAAARIEQQLSPLHRHLFLLGAHVGTTAAQIENTSGDFQEPPARLIRRHASLAGVSPALWQDLAQLPTAADKAAARRQYFQSIQALDLTLATAP